MTGETQKNLLYRFFVSRSTNLPASLEGRLFRLITLPNGTTKNTSPNRLDDLNEFIQLNMPSLGTPVFKDIAVSSGISTLEWLDFLEAKKIKAQISATDLYVKAWLYQRSSTVAILCDRNLNPVLVEASGSFFRTSFPRGSIRHRWGKIISMIIRALMLPKTAEAEMQKNPGGSSNVVPVELLTRAFHSKNNLSIKEEDIFLPPEKNETGKYDLIRAANILNKVYFTDAELEQILIMMARQLKPKGNLAICKTDEKGVNHASLFEIDNGRFKLVKNLNGGSEIEKLVLGLSIKE